MAQHKTSEASTGGPYHRGYERSLGPTQHSFDGGPLACPQITKPSAPKVLHARPSWRDEAPTKLPLERIEQLDWVVERWSSDEATTAQIGHQPQLPQRSRSLGIRVWERTDAIEQPQDH